MNSLQPVLLIEDDEVDVMTVKRCFKQLNISNEIIVAMNGEVAFDVLLKNTHKLPPSLILLDINLPKMNGLEFLEQFKCHERFKQIPVVMLTSSDEEKDINRCYQLGIAGYIIKPVEYEHFVENISILHQYWSMSELPR